MKRPVMYKDWRTLWHRESRELGHMIAHRFDGRSIIMTKSIYKKLQQVKRIELRLELEWMVRDNTWYEAVSEALNLGDSYDSK